MRIVRTMKHGFALLGVVALLLGITTASRAAETELRASKPATRKEIIATIDGQLAAFRSGDAARAYGFSAAELRAQKPLRTFVYIVQENYPEIWSSTRAEYGVVRDDGTHATVLVHVFGKNSDASYDYTLVKERAGWRVHDVLRHEKADRV
jgi:hypothetical protein